MRDARIFVLLKIPLTGLFYIFMVRIYATLDNEPSSTIKEQLLMLKLCFLSYVQFFFLVNYLCIFVVLGIKTWALCLLGCIPSFYF